MPTIEFFGFDSEQRLGMEARVRDRLTAEPFRTDCVFVDSHGSRVRDWQGNFQPFVRVSTRSKERAARFKEVLADVCDLEVVLIDFQPVSSCGRVPSAQPASLGVTAPSSANTTPVASQPAGPQRRQTTPSTAGDNA